ncbi:hypothetical protein EV426DRAFT_721555 [Tirmania nivea]|nr:hypothetical protein EV426DRAFT_721555 [Tirmania nivea]
MSFHKSGPKQDNDYDCGIYLLYAVLRFLDSKNPVRWLQKEREENVPVQEFCAQICQELFPKNVRTKSPTDNLFEDEDERTIEDFTSDDDDKDGRPSHRKANAPDVATVLGPATEQVKRKRGVLKTIVTPPAELEEDWKKKWVKVMEDVAYGICKRAKTSTGQDASTRPTRSNTTVNTVNKYGEYDRDHNSNNSRAAFLPQTQQQTCQPRPWTQEEVEQLIAWMEDNQEQLRGKQIAWYKEVKEQIFGDEDHITDAKAMQTRSGWGVKSEDNDKSINEVLERRCPFFWRLEEIWGSRPNVYTGGQQ